MAKRRHLPNAPIREALIDIVFEPQCELEAIDAIARPLAQQAGSLISDYFEAQFRVEAAGGTTRAEHSASLVGRRVDLREAKQVLQLKRGGFAFSQLPPYREWQDVRDAGAKYWKAFETVLSSRVVKRLGVRYINSLELPLPLRFEEYLTAAPGVPDSLSPSISGFLSRVSVPLGDDLATITQVLEGPTQDRKALRVMVDIDVTAIGLEISTGDFAQIWTTLDRLRDRKNDAFFELVTDKTLELYS